MIYVTIAIKSMSYLKDLLFRLQFGLITDTESSIQCNCLTNKEMNWGGM